MSHKGCLGADAKVSQYYLDNLVINMPPRPQARNWCFTLNNPDLDETQIAQALQEIGPPIYAIYQLEQGENGTPHFQGYVMFQDKVYLQPTLKNCLPTAHWEVAKGTPVQNRAYCSKPETALSPPCELGIFPESSQGKRTDLDSLKQALQAGLTPSQYAIEYFDIWQKHPNLVKHWYEAVVQPRKPLNRFTCKLFYGQAGTGKSTLASYLASAPEQPMEPFRYSLRGFWDGYIGQRRVLFDDFRGSDLSYGDFKRTVDKFPIRVNVKCSSCELAANEFFITSNFTPDEWWSEEVTGKDRSAIFRRITEVYFFPEKGKFRHYSSYARFAHFELNGALAPNLQETRPPLQEIILNDEEEILQIQEVQ